MFNYIKIVCVLHVFYITAIFAGPTFLKLGLERLEDPPYMYDQTNVTTLELVEVIFRHGARSPLASFPTDPNKDYDYGVKGLGQLTPRGVRLAYDFGKYLRKRYDGFFAPEYSVDEVDLLSSDIDRTIMTGQTVLTALFSTNCDGHPPSVQCPVEGLNWKPIPIRTIPDDLDNKIAFNAHCYRHERMYNRTLKSTKIRKLLKQNEQNSKRIKAEAGLKEVDLLTVQEIVDTFVVEVENGLTLPNWTKGLEQEILAKVVDLEFAMNTSTSALSQLQIGALLGHMVRNMEFSLGLNSNSSLMSDVTDLYGLRKTKGHFYSGHDTTISSFLNAFGLYEPDDQPFYVSAVFVEIHRPSSTPSNPDDYIIKLFYKNKRNEPIRELNFPQCLPPCTLSKFKLAYTKWILTDKQWNKLCRYKES